MKKNIYNTVMILISVMIFSFVVLNYVEENKSQKESSFEIFITSETTTVTETGLIIEEIETKTETIKTTLISETETKIETETETTVTEMPTTELTEIKDEVSYPININTAGIDELVQLDGIGEVTAEAIIEYREINGYFRNRDELLNVNGIGENKLEKIRDLIFVENETYDIDVNTDEYSEVETVEEIYEEYENNTENDYSDYVESESETEIIIVNINLASKEELMTLPYVTDEIADDIIQLRDTIQYFSHPYELLMVESLKQEQVAEIIKYVIVE